MKEIEINLIKENVIERIVVLCRDGYFIDDGKWFTCEIDAKTSYSYNVSHILSIKTKAVK